LPTVVADASRLASNHANSGLKNFRSCLQTSVIRSTYYVRPGSPKLNGSLFWDTVPFIHCAHEYNRTCQRSYRLDNDFITENTNNTFSSDYLPRLFTSVRCVRKAIKTLIRSESGLFAIHRGGHTLVQFPTNLLNASRHRKISSLFGRGRIPSLFLRGRAGI